MDPSPLSGAFGSGDAVNPIGAGGLRWWIVAPVVLVVLCGSALCHSLFFAQDTPFLRRAGGAPWIEPRFPVDSNLVGVDPAAVPIFTFVKRFSARRTGEEARLETRALRLVGLELNGHPLPKPANAASWRNFFRIEIGDLLVPGRNELRVRVRNPHGPPLLQLRLELEGQTIDTDARWQVRTPTSNPVPARLADDTRPHPDSRLLPEPGQVLRTRAMPLGLLFAASTLLFALGRRLRSRWLHAHAATIALGTITLFWLALFVTKLAHMPVMMGFDAPAHLGYLKFIATHHALPLANDGFSSYHPPVFYLLTSLLVWLVGASPTSPSGPIVYRTVSFLSGLANVWLCYFVARALWSKEDTRVALAVVVAGLLPMNVYLSAYVSNESLHAAWVSLALLLTTRLMLRPRVSLGLAVALGAALGLALLTKFTSLLIAPLILFYVACKLRRLDGERFVRVLALCGGALLAVVAIAGWFYLRNWLVFGDPVVWNLDVPGAPTWWMQPGFHTAAYYTRFGESLRHPFFAGFVSFWDGVYSTLWGDGLVAGMRSVASRHTLWHYDYMSLGYWLAFPASVLFALGFGRLARSSMRLQNARRAALLSLFSSLLFALAISLLLISLRLPFYAQAKAFYVLAGIVPLALAGAEGLAAPMRVASKFPGTPFWQSLYAGWLGSLGGVLVMAFLG